MNPVGHDGRSISSQVWMGVQIFLVVAVLDIDSQAGITKLSLLTFLLKRWLSPNGTLSRSVA